MSNEDRAECIQLYMDGATLDMLAKRYDRDRTTIDKLMEEPVSGADTHSGRRAFDMADDKRILIDYTNHAGLRSIREIVPLNDDALKFGSTEWHHDPQWLLDAYDVAKDDMRTFAVKDIHAWAPTNTATGRSMASYAKQLQQSMEMNARMKNRLKKLQAECNDFEPRKTVIDDIDAILKDEDF